MFFERFKKNQRKTLLFLAGFLVILLCTALGGWFYINFWVSQDSFLEAVPVEAAVYWHESAGGKLVLAWLYDLSQRMLLGEAAGQAKFLFENVAPDSSQTALAILPGFEDFIFWGYLDVRRFNELKEKLESLNFNYIFEDDGKITITNTKIALKEVLAALSQKTFSLADQKVRLITFNRAIRRFPAQIYFDGNFKFDNFYPLSLKSDFWETSRLNVAREEGVREGGRADYHYLLTTDNAYLTKDTENILKNNLAVALPEIKEKKLPDETVVREMIANPDLFIFEKAKMAGEEVKYLSISQLNQEIFLAKTNGLAAVSNSRELMADYLGHLDFRQRSYGKNLLDFLLEWARWATADFNGIVFGVDLR